MTDESAAPISAAELAAPFVAGLGAATMTTQYVSAALVLAAEERGAIDPARVFQLLEVLAKGFDGGAAGDHESTKMTALMLRGVREVYQNLRTIPTGAGRA